jgi:hypothetical protein
LKANVLRLALLVSINACHSSSPPKAAPSPIVPTQGVEATAQGAEAAAQGAEVTAPPAPPPPQLSPEVTGLSVLGDR